MAAYRAYVHEATGYTPNFLTLGRETLAPLVIVLGPPKEDTDLWDSHDSFVADQQERMRIVYAVTRENLRRCAERRKKPMNCGFASNKLNMVRRFGTTTHTAGLDDHRSGRGTT